MSNSPAASFRLFLDLDGVLADFDTGVQRVTGKLPAEQSPRAMWPQLARAKEFYATLPWIADGPELWRYAAKHDPIILTGVPFGGWAAEQKRRWCERELGPAVRVITCWSKEKAHKAIAELAARNEKERTPILVDDREKMRDPWVAAGGLFILHTSAAESIAALQEIGL